MTLKNLDYKNYSKELLETRLAYEKLGQTEGQQLASAAALVKPTAKATGAGAFLGGQTADKRSQAAADKVKTRRKPTQT